MGILLNPATAVWAFLMLATCASTWWLSKDGVSPATAMILIMIIAAVKVSLIMNNFMELGHAPIRWRIMFGAWTVTCTAIILIVYLH